MTWDTIQQLIRIGAYAGGSMFFGKEIADGDLYQAAIGGVISVGAFVWWMMAQSKKPE